MQNKQGQRKPLDHYVPQIYLDQWKCGEHGSLHVFRKLTGEVFHPQPKGVCAERDGSTNKFLIDKREIENFLASFENRIIPAIQAISTNSFCEENILSLSRLLASISVCSPTARRIHLNMLRELIRTSASMMDKKGVLPKLRGESITDLIDSNKVKLRVHDRFSESVAVPKIEEMVKLFTNSRWEFLHNRTTIESFLTSDYPLGISDAKANPAWNSKIVPLTPNLAVRIEPMYSSRNKNPFHSFSSSRKAVSKSELHELNKVIARCAENLIVFKSHNKSHVDFLSRNSKYRIRGAVTNFTGQNGSEIINKQLIGEWEPDADDNELPVSDEWFEFVPNT